MEKNNNLLLEFVTAAFLLGQELVSKDKLTEKEKLFLVYLDKVGDLILHDQR
jgi:hypothetical protein